MNDKGAYQEFFDLVKTVVDNYMKCRKPAAVLMGTYTGSAVVIGKIPVPMSMVTGNMKDRLVSGDKVRILRNARGKEYYILEIIAKPYQTGG